MSFSSLSPSTVASPPIPDAVMTPESGGEGEWLPVGDTNRTVEGSPKGWKAKDLEPRGYQVAIFEVAVRRNTIAMLKTGAGKTMISLMLIKHFWKEMTQSGKNRQIIVFLAPTVHLVCQQCDQIAIHTDLDVTPYYGAKGVDEWTAECWKEELSTHQIMVMTPQILLDALRNAFLFLSGIRFIIFDECHRATGNHPYTRIMKEFYHRSFYRPHVFGMTASPVTRKGVSSAFDGENQIEELESILDSKIYTVADKTELEAVVPSAKETTVYYEPMVDLRENLTAQLEISWRKFDNSIDNMQKSSGMKFKDSESALNSSRRKLSSFHKKISDCIKTLGLFCAREATRVCMQNSSIDSLAGVDDLKDGVLSCHAFLKEVLGSIEKALPRDLGKLLDTKEGCLEAVRIGCISPKLCELIRIFESFGTTKKVLCLIFVEKKITAKVIPHLVKTLRVLSHLEVSFLTGGSSSVDALTQKMQKETLDLFRTGKVNLLFTTDVAEEGIHVPNCSCVIRFDLPKTVRSYVQSRGRARQVDSQYIIMLEKGDIQQQNRLSDIMRGENSMTDTALNSDPNAAVTNFCCKEDLDVYCVESTGATITADSSITLVNKYCGKLPKDRYFNPGPEFLISNLYGGSYKCRLTLPPNAAFRILDGPICHNSRLAKRLVCLEACKKLHHMGALNDYLLPICDVSAEAIPIVKHKEVDSGAGTKKRKELHGTVAIRALSGSWLFREGEVSLNAYRVDFLCDMVGQKYSSFALLIDTELDDDVGHLELDLFLVDKLVKSFVLPCGSVSLDSEKVEKAKIFQQFFFNGLFGKLFTGSKSSGGKREFIFDSGSDQLWNTSYMYLLLPVYGCNSTNNLKINWEAVGACAPVVRFIQNAYKPGLHAGSFSMEGPIIPKLDSVKICDNKMHSILLANKVVPQNELNSMLVIAIHTGKIYSVLDIVVNTSASSPFDTSSYTSYADYFEKKYGIFLKHPGQPLLLLKHTHNPHNLLSSKANDDGSIETIVKKPQSRAHMPPELLIHVDVPMDVLKSFYLLPSLMQRLESLMLASQLRREIPSHDCNVPSSLILEALTTMRCSEDFSLERLELLGDSVLKYAVSRALFLKFPQNHEGKLSSSRSHAVCNATLHKLGTDRNIQGYVRDAAFDPRRWVAPGQASLHAVHCRCQVNDSEFPPKVRFVTEEKSIVIGKACDRGHRWMCSKTIADCVEALIGAYFVGGGLMAALSFMTWLGLDVEFDYPMLDECIKVASLYTYLPKIDEIEAVESKMNYTFSTKGLLLEAITHASYDDLVPYCYQRLEFLGDSVLDLLITHYLFKCYSDIDPGELTDLRSASVNNENFAKVAVRHKLHRHFLHGSAFLLEQISDFVKSCGGVHSSNDASPSSSLATAPKVLGDIVESIAGAMLIDTKLNIDSVWETFKVLLSPITTPQDLELPPFRELNEMCSHLGYFLKCKCSIGKENVVAELSVQLEDAFLVEKGHERSSKAARAHAATLLLAKLEGRGLSHSKHSGKRKQESQAADVSPSGPMEHKNANFNGHKLNGIVPKRSKTFGSEASESASTSWCNDEKAQSHCICEASNGHHISDADHAYEEALTVQPMDQDASDFSQSNARGSQVSIPVLSVKMQKGGPRTSLYELCKKLMWPMPTFEAAEVPGAASAGITGKKSGVKKFKSKITLRIPNTTAALELTGGEHLDKKSSYDSAALLALYELQRLGRCQINKL